MSTAWISPAPAAKKLVVARSDEVSGLGLRSCSSPTGSIASRQGRSFSPHGSEHSEDGAVSPRKTDGGSCLNSAELGENVALTAVTVADEPCRPISSLSVESTSPLTSPKCATRPGASSRLLHHAEGARDLAARDVVFRAWLDSLLFNFEYFLREVNTADSATRDSGPRLVNEAGEQPKGCRSLLHEQQLRIHKLAKELMSAADSTEGAPDFRGSNPSILSNADFRRFSSVPAPLEFSHLVQQNGPLARSGTSDFNAARPQSVPADSHGTLPQGRRLSLLEQTRACGQMIKRRIIQPKWQSNDVAPYPMLSRSSSAMSLQTEPPLTGGFNHVLSMIADVEEEAGDESSSPKHMAKNAGPSADDQQLHKPPPSGSFAPSVDATPSGSNMVTPSATSNVRSSTATIQTPGPGDGRHNSLRSAKLDRQATALIVETVQNDSARLKRNLSFASVVAVRKEFLPWAWRVLSSPSTLRKALADIYFVAMMYSLVFTPVVVCLLNPPSSGVSVLEVLCECLFIANAAALFTLGTEDMANYGTTFWFEVQQTPWIWTQLVVAVPWHLLWLISDQSILLALSMLRLVNLPKLISESVFANSEAHLGDSSTLASVHPNLLRVGRLIALFFLMVHLIACGYYSVAESRGGEWAIYAVESTSSLLSKWTHAFYWALCGVLGENMDPTTDEEVSYNSACTAVGVMLNSCIVGSITSLLGSLDERAAKQKAKLDTINAFMHKNGVTPELCEQVRNYYKYLYASRSNQELLFEELSASLRLKIDLCIHKKFIKQCHIFSSCSPECIATLVMIISRNSSIFVPRELVFRKGDIGDAMYFVAKGEVMLYDPGNVLDENFINLEDLRDRRRKHAEEGGDEAKALAMAKAGDFFGELALLMTDNVRSASAASMTFAELLCLPRLDFDRVLLWYPQFATHLQTVVWNKSSVVLPIPLNSPPPMPNSMDDQNEDDKFSESSWASKIYRQSSQEKRPSLGGLSEVRQNDDVLYSSGRSSSHGSANVGTKRESFTTVVTT